MKILLAVDGSKHSLDAVDSVHVRAARCDLVFIGTHGRSATGNMLLGSVATKVLHLASVPVLLVR